MSSVLSRVGAFLKEKHDYLLSLIAVKADKSSSEDIEIVDHQRGIILRSPSQKRFRITVDDNGDLQTTEIT